MDDVWDKRIFSEWSSFELKFGETENRFRFGKPINEDRKLW